ncbi:MAG: PD-(D/E)XK nuclease family protein [Clostridia bacterium]|nr:PD-(D/E)XK nuclease family protein [Clostridia bacterium]
MIRFIYGPTGSGKTTRITEEIREKLKNGAQVILLCPEQEAVIAERKLTEELLGRVPTENLEVLNFGRLPERIFRLYGGLTTQDIGEGGRRLIMRRALASVGPELTQYREAADDPSMVDKLLSVVSEFKMCCISPADLEETARVLSEDSGRTRLCDKLDDFAVIYAYYEQLLHKNYHDPEDMLAHLESVLSKDGGAFFDGKEIYLDGFHGYTAQQYTIIRRMISRAASVTVSLACRWGGVREPMLRRVYETEDRLYSLARDAGIVPEHLVLTENLRTEKPALRFLRDHLWSVGETETIPADGAVRVFSCTDPFAEAEAIALDIRHKVMEGCRYRDITVILRDVSQYEGILDIMMEKYGIPAYMARRSAVQSKPFFRYLHCLFSIYTYRYRKQDVIGLIKTGLTGLDERDTFLFENYITTWNLSGSRITEDEDWTMHPQGYRETVTEDDLAALAAANRVRRCLTEQLEPFFSRMRAKKNATVLDIAGWLFDFLESAGIPAQLDRIAEDEREMGDLSGSEETAQLWDIFVSSLDTLVTTAGDLPCLAADFMDLYDLLIADLDIGSIPARSDEVVIGDASLLRPDNASHIYLMGVTDGAFPMTPAEDALFSDYEKEILRDNGMELSQDTEGQMKDELFHFYSAACAAKEQLTVSYPCADLSGKSFRPSIGAERILAMFSDVKPENPAELPPEYGLVTENSAFEIMAYSEHTPLGQALYDYFRDKAADDPVLSEKLKALDEPLTARHNQLSRRSVNAIFGEDRIISMSQSRLESYVKCHFRYFCDYILRLQEQRRAVFGSADIGSFVHAVLEGFVNHYNDAEEKEKMRDPLYLDGVISALVEQYVSSVSHTAEGTRQPMRVKHLIGRLKRQATVIVKKLISEFEHSDFLPRDVELTIGADDGKSIPALRIDSADGLKVRLTGKIDRVDTYEKDGNTYLRVVDYKTHVKDFKVEDIKLGLNMQMLLYLFSVWKNGGGHYPGELTPAAIHYTAAAPNEQTVNTVPSADEAEAAAERAIDSKGLYIDDREILHAMDYSWPDDLCKKDGSFKSSASVQSLEEFGRLLGDTQEIVLSIVREMKDGNADAVPISKTHPEAKLTPCDYCGMKPICRGSMSHV